LSRESWRNLGNLDTDSDLWLLDVANGYSYPFVYSMEAVEQMPLVIFEKLWSTWTSVAQMGGHVVSDVGVQRVSATLRRRQCGIPEE
jgi:hypothetical protein